MILSHIYIVLHNCTALSPNQIVSSKQGQYLSLHLLGLGPQQVENTLRLLKQFLIQILLLTEQGLEDTENNVLLYLLTNYDSGVEHAEIYFTGRFLQITKKYSRSIYAKGVRCEPFCTYPTLQLYLPQLSAILFIHRARLGIHHL